MLGILYVVGTPIGNLEDVTLRAIKTLRDVDLILAEDTRVTGKLLSRLEVQTPLSRFDANAPASQVAKIINALENGKNIALVSDAGTPAVSDPGAWLVAEAVRILGTEVKIVPIPGPSAVTAALSVSGFYTDIFTFYGFLPPKKGRSARLDEICASPNAVVFFESPHRINKTLLELATRAPTRRAVICRELTKMFETVERGTIAELSAPGRVRPQGELVIVLAPIS
jgi:16S rRNA (cytidine1402-2'-O)-methyltransferase